MPPSPCIRIALPSEDIGKLKFFDVILRALLLGWRRLEDLLEHLKGGDIKFGEATLLPQDGEMALN